MTMMMTMSSSSSSSRRRRQPQPQASSSLFQNDILLFLFMLLLLLLLFAPVGTAALDCGCPETCTAEALAERNDAPWTCQDRIGYLMSRYKATELQACTGSSKDPNEEDDEANALQPCRPEACHPEKCGAAGGGGGGNGNNIIVDELVETPKEEETWSSPTEDNEEQQKEENDFTTESAETQFTNGNDDENENGNIQVPTSLSGIEMEAGIVIGVLFMICFGCSFLCCGSGNKIKPTAAISGGAGNSRSKFRDDPEADGGSGLELSSSMPYRDDDNDDDED